VLFVDLIQSGNVRDECATANVDEDLGRSEPFVPNSHRPSRSEAGMALVHRDIGVVAERPFYTPRREAQDIVLALFHFFHVDCDRSGNRHAEVFDPAGEMGGIGARHKRLGRGAARIDARAAEAMAFDHSNSLSRCS